MNSEYIFKHGADPMGCTWYQPLKYVLFICNLLADPNEGETKNNYLYYGNDPVVDEDIEWNDLDIEAIIHIHARYSRVFFLSSLYWMCY